MSGLSKSMGFYESVMRINWDKLRKLMICGVKKLKVVKRGECFALGDFSASTASLVFSFFVKGVEREAV